jgi:transcriptional repressor NrdR
VAYLRFASVYQAFESLEDFEAAITILRAEREAAGWGNLPLAGDQPGEPSAAVDARSSHP